ncbi:response regulator [Flavobacterium sp.]|uniref:response regulator transcription factor n=1 Tax=Flavobacterium sp. TaxID=239 RepID=UPI0035274127
MEEKTSNLRFLLADDHSIIRQGLELLIEEEFLSAEVQQVGNIKEVLHKLNETTFDILVLDISFPDGNSLSYLPNILEIQPKLKILIFTAFEEDLYALRYIKAGAVGYLNKLSEEKEIKTALQNLVIKGKHISPNIQEQILESYLKKTPLNPLDKLSDREMEVATLLVKGYGNLEVSTKLDIKQNTISTLKSRVFQKLEIQNLPELIQIFNVYFEE